MTDYLEQTMDESADALLEQQRRLERLVLSGGWSQETAQVSEPEEAGQSAAPGSEAPVTRGLRYPASQEPVGLQRSGLWLEQQVQERARQETKPGVRGLVSPLEETVSVLGSAQESDVLLPLQRQSVRTEQILDAARRLPAQWGGTALRKRESFSTTTGMARDRSWSSGFAAETQEPRLSASLSGRNGMERDWTKQVDRAFRRDSRRYDNGFFLY